MSISNLKSELIKLEDFAYENLKNPKYVLAIVGGLGTAYFLQKTVSLYIKRRKVSHLPGPPTHGIIGFFTGNMREIKEGLKQGKILPEIMSEWHNKYGDVYKFQMYNRVMVLVSDKNATKEILIVKNYPKIDASSERVGFPMGERFLGYGLVTDLDHERWKYRRAIFNPGFHRHVLVTFVGHFNQIVNNLEEKFRPAAEKKSVIHLMNELNRATLDAIALIAFGMNIDAVNKQDSILNVYLSKSLKSLMSYFFDPFMTYRPSKFAEVKELRKMIRYLRKLGKDRIMERVTAYKNNEHMPDDILSSILQSYKGENLDIESMTDDFITFFVAGQETTANTLAFCFLELGRNPEIMKNAQEEIDRVLGKRTEVSYQDVTDLKYCSAIFKEALRLYPPAASIGRKIKDKMSICGYELPKDTDIFLSTYVNGRAEKNFKNALEFKPERFLKSTAESELENYVFFPFSLGPRNCIGQNFAQLEGVIVIAKLLQTYDFRLDPTQSFAVEQALTLKPKDGTRVYVSLRS